MMLRISSFIFLTVFVALGMSKSCGPAVEEGESAEIACGISESFLFCQEDDVTWLMENVGGAKRKICLLGPNCKQDRRRVLGFGSTTIIKGSSMFKSTLRINKVSRTSIYNEKSVWTCQLCREKSIACDDMEIYYKPRGVSCSTRHLTGKDNKERWISINCSTAKVYPKVSCEFKGISKYGEMLVTKSPNYTHTMTMGRPKYYKSQCSIELPEAELGVGRYRFEVLIYPNVTGGRAYGVVAHTKEMLIQSSESQRGKENDEVHNTPNTYKTALMVVAVVSAIILLILIIVIVFVSRAYVNLKRRHREEEQYENGQIGLADLNGHLDSSGINPASGVYEGYVHPSALHSPSQNYDGAYQQPSGTTSPCYSKAHDIDGYDVPSTSETAAYDVPSTSETAAYDVPSSGYEEKAHLYQDLK